MARTKHGKSWIGRHLNDPYVQKAQKEGYRSRASYKLLELHKSAQLFATGMTILDLGAAPGGWSQVLRKLVGRQGTVLALDLLEMQPLAGVTCIQGDFACEETILRLRDQLGEKTIDWVVSDMSPNLSGLTSVDQPRVMRLAELTLTFACAHLRQEGGLLVKVFQGEGFEAFLKLVRQHFKKVSVRKPSASRSASRELYVLARGYYNM